MMQDLAWTTTVALAEPVDWRDVDLAAERIGALPDAPMPMPMQSLDLTAPAARPALWLRLRSVLTARAGL